MLYNLIASNKTDLFNQIAPMVKLTKLNFNKFSTTKVNQLNGNRFLIVNRITRLAQKDPELALNEFHELDDADTISANTKTFLANYIALQFALQQEFLHAIKLFEEYPSSHLSSTEHEWRTRSYLATANWKAVISSIHDMPESLKNKNVWLYWLAKSYDNINQTELATIALQQIPNDYSYYSLLASAELDKLFVFKVAPSQATSIPSTTPITTNFKHEVDYAINLYTLSKTNNCRSLGVIGTYQWYYLSRMADDTQRVTMSNMARKLGFYNLSIYTANEINNRYMELSFPLPFMNHFTKYSRNQNLDLSYPLAISRQESRFNYNVTAFDGGMGLMQLMPQTANYIMHKAGYSNCSKMTPECNIKFGTWYLGNLHEKFGNLIYSTAAYNAGPNRPKRWYNKLINFDNRIQIELIPIAITRDYVQKVITNKAIYDSELNRTAKVNLRDYIEKINKNAPHNMSVLSDDTTDASKLK
jgi:soluble lytic murein transglycosylase